jgi:NAD-dependent SIR2 family protein deacetylase
MNHSGVAECGAMNQVAAAEALARTRRNNLQFVFTSPIDECDQQAGTGNLGHIRNWLQSLVCGSA